MNSFRKSKLENIKISLNKLQKELVSLYGKEVNEYYVLPNQVQDSVKGEQIHDNFSCLWSAASCIEDILGELENIN